MRLILREMVVLLGFNKQTFTLMNSRYRHGTAFGLVLVRAPRLQELAEKYFNCELGVPLGDYFWDSRFLHGELMANPLVKGLPAFLSEFTLAVLEFTGWYDIDWTLNETEFMIFARGKGCSFFDFNCLNPSYCKNKGTDFFGGQLMECQEFN
jgi:hypothetical protein